MRTPSIASVLPGGAARRPVLLLSLGSFALGTDAFVISGVLPSVADDLGVTLAVTGLLITVFSGVYAVSAPILAVVTSTINRKHVLLGSMAVFVLANLLAAAAPNYGVMVAARVIAALGAATYMPAASVSAAVIAPEQERGRALAAVLGGLTLATALGVPLGTLIGQGLQWRATFLFVAALGLVAWLGLAFELGQIPAPPVATLHDRIVAGAQRGIPVTLLATVIAISGIFTLYTYLTWFADRTAGISGSAVTVIYLIYGVGAVISNLVAGWLVDRMAPARVALISMVGLAVAFILLAMLAGANKPAGAPVLLGILVAGWSLIGWMFNPAQQQRLLKASGPTGPVVLSLNASAIYAGQAVGGFVGGLLLTHGAGPLAITAAICEVVAVVVVLGSMQRLSTTGPAPVAGPDASDQHASDQDASDQDASGPAGRDAQPAASAAKP